MSDPEAVGVLTRRELLFLAGTGLSLAGMPESGEAQEKKPRYGGRLRMGHPYGSAGLDVHRNQDFADYLNYSLMYNGLADIGPLPDIKMYPELARSWDISPDGREYVFALREGVKFHHGKDLDSGDVKYSLDRVMNPATRAPRAFAFRWIDSVTTIDKQHLRIRLKEPFAPFITALTPYNCSIIPAGWEPTSMKPAPGTGPFVFKSFVPNETIELARFSQYWEYDEKTGDRLPYADAVYMKKIVDASVRWTALRAGDLDITYGPPGNIVADAILRKPVPGIVMQYDSPGNGCLVFNVTRPPFDDKRVRQAFAFALDKKKIAEAIFWGLGQTLNNQPFPESSSFYVPVPDRGVDLAKARQLLAEAGYPHGFKTEFLQYSFAYHVAAAETAIGELKNIGVEATMKVLDRAPFFSMLRKGEFNLWFGSLDERFDWDDAYYMHLHSSEIGKNNWSGYRNKELDELLEKGRTTLRFADRVPFYKRAVEIIREDLPFLFVYKTVAGYAHHEYVKGVRKGFSLRPAWHGGGTKYWWIDK